MKKDGRDKVSVLKKYIQYSRSSQARKGKKRRKKLSEKAFSAKEGRES